MLLDSYKLSHDVMIQSVWCEIQYGRLEQPKLSVHLLHVRKLTLNRKS